MALNIGAMDKRVSLANPAAPTSAISDGKGGYTETFTALSPADVWAAVTPAPAGVIEREFGNVVAAVASHLVGMRYHSGVNTKTRIVYTFTDPAGASHTQTLYVRGVQDVQQRHERLICACEEVVS